MEVSQLKLVDSFISPLFSFPWFLWEYGLPIFLLSLASKNGRSFVEYIWEGVEVYELFDKPTRVDTI